MQKKRYVPPLIESVGISKEDLPAGATCYEGTVPGVGDCRDGQQPETGACSFGTNPAACDIGSDAQTTCGGGDTVGNVCIQGGTPVSGCYTGSQAPGGACISGTNAVP